MKIIFVSVLLSMIFLCGCSSEKGDSLNSDIVYMGTYEQDNNAENGEEKIEWTILDETEGKRLLISSYTIDMKPISSVTVSKEYVDWADSEIREWLNGEFLQNHFSDEERALILETNLEYIGGKSSDSFESMMVTDKVFYLSLDEAEKYFKQDRNKLMGKGMTSHAFYNTGMEARTGDAVNNSKVSGLVTRDKGETEYYDDNYKGFLFWAIGGYLKEDDETNPAITCIYTRIRTSVRPAMWISITE